jgi:competence protein ComFA
MEKEGFICPRCGNADPRYIGYLNGKPYCRRCLGFAGNLAKPMAKSGKLIRLHLDYRLSKVQFKVANEVKKNFIKGKDALIHAVTGAGKTELVYYTIEYALSRQMSVGFAIPRRDVVIDLFPRLKEAFPDAETVYVVGKHTEKLSGDIILLTTHQLYRYPKYFDLLIIDEIDAFPFKGDPVLNRFAADAVRGHIILLSATPSEEDIRKMKKKGAVFELLSRYHHHPLPVPVFKKAQISLLLRGIKELKRLLTLKKPVFFFVPTIKEGETVFPIISKFCKGGRLVDSESPDREEIVKAFKAGQLNYLVTTSILERGVTVKGLQVIVYHANHVLYTKQTLIQIAGRAGRKKEEPDGEVIFIGDKENENIRDAIREIQETNFKAGL